MIRITIIVKMTTDYTETKYITAKYLLNIKYFIGQQESQLPPWTGAMKLGFMSYFSLMFTQASILVVKTNLSDPNIGNSMDCGDWAFSACFLSWFLLEVVFIVTVYFLTSGLSLKWSFSFLATLTYTHDKVLALIIKIQSEEKNQRGYEVSKDNDYWQRKIWDKRSIIE